MTLTPEQIKAMHGQGGYWCQGDAVHIQSTNEMDAFPEGVGEAIASYRLKMSQGAISITSNLDTLDAYKAKVANEAKNLAYSERNKMLAAYCRLAIASGFTAGIGRHQGDGWDDDWRNIVFIDTPNGQASFHLHDSELHLFNFLPPYQGQWDGHDTETKWNRLLTANSEFITVNPVRADGSITGFYSYGHHDKNQFWEAMSNKYGPRKAFDAANSKCIAHECWIVDERMFPVTVFWF